MNIFESFRRSGQSAFQAMEREFDGVFGQGGNPLRHLGALGMMFFWILGLTGIYLYIVLDTGIQDVYDSVLFLTREQWWLGGLFRSLHRYSAVAGMLRLDLAQYRELAAFAQFASDLDKTTRAQLERGERMKELLKQDQYVPMPIEEQIILMFAGTQGLVDDVPVEAISSFEESLLSFLRAKKEALKNEVREKKALDDDLKGKITDAVNEFKKTFQA